MIDLKSFVRVDFLRNELLKGSVVVSNVTEADQFAMSVSDGIIQNVIFETTALKSYCFEKIMSLCEGVKIINCNSCLERFCEELDSDSIKIFDNVNRCTDVNVLDILANKKGILVC